MRVGTSLRQSSCPAPSLGQSQGHFVQQYHTKSGERERWQRQSKDWAPPRPHCFQRKRCSTLLISVNSASADRESKDSSSYKTCELRCHAENVERLREVLDGNERLREGEAMKQRRRIARIEMVAHKRRGLRVAGLFGTARGEMKGRNREE